MRVPSWVAPIAHLAIAIALHRRQCSRVHCPITIASLLLQGMYNEARGRMDEAQQWYEGIMEKASLDQGALKRQIAQVGALEFRISFT